VGKWVVLLVAALGLVVGSIWWLSRGQPNAERLYGELIPAWQIHRSTELRQRDSKAAGAMLRAARPWPALATALQGLDSNYPDDVPAHAATINRAARSAGVPFWLDVQTVKSRGVVLSYRIDGIHTWRSADKTVEILRLRRVDHLNVELGILGQASSNGPLVFLDRIEDELVDELARLADPGAPSSVEGTGRTLLASMARLQVGEVLSALTHDLARRSQRFDAMQGRMKVVVPQPSGLVWSERWFDHIETLTKFGRGRGPLVFDSDLREVRDANRALGKPEYEAAMATLVELRAQGVEAHEARHALDTPSPPLPGFLRAWANPDFAEQINQELRAYLGELHDTPGTACDSVVALTRAAFAPKARLTPHFFAGRIILYGLAGKPLPEAQADAGSSDGLRAVLDGAVSGVAPVAIMRSECAAPRAELRERVATVWRRLYGEPMPTLTRDQDDAPARP
jgi:hypothetical protein